MLLAKNMIIAYAFKAPDYIMYHPSQMPKSGQPKEKYYGQNSSVLRHNHLQESDRNEKSKTAKSSANDLPN